jgi:hypothetical protein
MFKLTNNMKNRDCKWIIGPNEKQYDDGVTGGGGIYFCKASDIPFWAYKYTHISEIIIPMDARVRKYETKLQSDKLILKSNKPIEEYYANLGYAACLDAVTKNGHMLKFMSKKQNKLLSKIAVTTSGLALQYVDEQSYEICEAAIRNTCVSLQYVKNQLPELCRIAMEQNPCAIKFITNPLLSYLSPFRKIRFENVQED